MGLWAGAAAVALCPLLFVWALCLPVAAAQGGERQKITVCAREAFPFVIDAADEDTYRVLPIPPAPFDYKAGPGGKRYMGFDIEMMISLSSELGLDFELQMYGSLEEVIEGVKNANATGCDVGMGGLAVYSEHESLPAGGMVPSVVKPCCVDYTFPYLHSGLVLVVPLDMGDPDSKRLIQAMFSSSGVNSIAWLMVCLGVAAHLMWFFEHKNNPEEFPAKYLDGIDDAVWWAATTVTTVGYGDKVPRSGFGRLVGVCWMFTSIIVLSTFTGIISSELTTSAVSGRTPETLVELSGRPVCVVGPRAHDYVDQNRGNGIVERQGADFLACLGELNAGRVEAILHDKASVDFYFKYYADQTLETLETSTILDATAFAMVTPEGRGLGMGSLGGPGLNRKLSEGILAYLHGRAVSTSVGEIRPFQGRSSSTEMWFGRSQAGLLTPSVSDGGERSDRREDESGVDWATIWFLVAMFTAYGGVHLYILVHNKTLERTRHGRMVDVEVGSTGGADSPRARSIDAGAGEGSVSSPGIDRSNVADSPLSVDAGVKDSAYSAGSRATLDALKQGVPSSRRTMLGRVTTTLSRAVGKLTDDIATDDSDDSNMGGFGSGLYPYSIPLSSQPSLDRPGVRTRLRSASADSSPMARSAQRSAQSERSWRPRESANGRAFHGLGQPQLTNSASNVSARLDDAESDPGDWRVRRRRSSGQSGRGKVGGPRGSGDIITLTQAIERMEEKIGSQMAMQVAEMRSFMGGGLPRRTTSMDASMALSWGGAGGGAPLQRLFSPGGRPLEHQLSGPLDAQGFALASAASTPGRTPATGPPRSTASGIRSVSDTGALRGTPRVSHQNSGKSIASDGGMVGYATSPRFSHLSSVPRSDMSFVEDGPSPSPGGSSEEPVGAAEEPAARQKSGGGGGAAEGEPVARRKSAPVLSQLAGYGQGNSEAAGGVTSFPLRV